MDALSQPIDSDEVGNPQQSAKGPGDQPTLVI